MGPTDEPEIRKQKMEPQNMSDILRVEIPVSDGIEEDFNPEEAKAFARWLEI